MLNSKFATALLSLITLSSVGSAATFTTFDVSSYVNSNVAFNPNTFPIGTSMGNKGSGIPFNIAPYNGVAGTWNALFSNSGVLDVHVAVSGQTSFYALLNNYYGTPGADEYDITFKATNGDFYTYQSIGGVDTRDYNQNRFTNTIAGMTSPWDDNGIGQRLDVREFNLPASFANDTISDFIITQVNGNDTALFSGLTFSNAAASPVPEPFGAGLVGMGLAALALLRKVMRTQQASN